MGMAESAEEVCENDLENGTKPSNRKLLRNIDPPLIRKHNPYLYPERQFR